MENIEKLELKLNNMDDRQRKDHDLLILMDGKLSSLISSVEGMKNDHNRRFNNLEIDVSKLKETDIKISPENLVTDVKDLKDWKEKFGFTWKLIAVVSASISAVVSFVLALFALSSNLFK